MTTPTITGDEQIDRRLIHLSQKGATRAARKAVNKGMKVIEKGIRAAAPVGKTQGLKKAVGSRNKRRRGAGISEAKIGIGVGKKRGVAAPHAHLVALGTANRFRKKVGGEFARFEEKPGSSKATGTTPANDFVKRGFQGAESAAASAVVDTLDVEIQKEAAKAS